MDNLKQINDFHEKQMEAMLGFLEPKETEYDAWKETRDFCAIEDCAEPATIEIKDLDFKGNRTWFCEKHASSFEAREKYLELEENKATGN